MYSSSRGFMSMRRRPNPHRSLNPGCAPMLTPSAAARLTSRCIVTGSPAWNPQAMLAERMIFINEASSPISQAPKPSPISALRLIAFAMPGSSLYRPASYGVANCSKNSMPVRFLSVGDRALVVEFGDAIDRGLSREVLRLDRVLRAAPPAGVVETVPTFRSLMVHYDPLSTSRADLEHVITGLLDRDEGADANARLWHIPVCYEAEFAPDLAEAARLTGLSPGNVVTLHSATRYHVYMLGCLPGFPYLGDLPAALALPRRADPRVRVPAGSIAIATALTAIYPYQSPGGWHLIGATPIRCFDAARTPPALLAAGDAVLFEPIDADAFAVIRRAIPSGGYAIDS